MSQISIKVGSSIAFNNQLDEYKVHIKINFLW